MNPKPSSRRSSSPVTGTGSPVSGCSPEVAARSAATKSRSLGRSPRPRLRRRRPPPSSAWPRGCQWRSERGASGDGAGVWAWGDGPGGGASRGAAGSGWAGLGGDARRPVPGRAGLCGRGLGPSAVGAGGLEDPVDQLGLAQAGGGAEPERLGDDLELTAFLAFQQGAFEWRCSTHVAPLQLVASGGRPPAEGGYARPGRVGGPRGVTAMVARPPPPNVLALPGAGLPRSGQKHQEAGARRCASPGGATGRALRGRARR
jgi:hypothetical protein